MTTPDPTNAATVPTLQPPGAGLPRLELLFTRYLLLPFAFRALDWNKASALFHQQGRKVLAVWDALPAERLAERVLVRPILGIEASSRFWSMAMTVEHLNIVGFGIRGIIAGLRHGKTPARATRIQDVKPRGKADPSAVRQDFARLLSEAAAGSKSEPPVARGEGPCAPHPWFGPLDAYQWHCLLGLHQQIHRKQAEAIRDALDGR